MKSKMFLFLLTISCSGFSLQIKAQSRYSTAKPDIKDFTIHSKILGEERKYSVYRPPVLPEYAEAVSPIIYVLDGEWVSFFFVRW
jgi:hypothetical protein